MKGGTVIGQEDEDYLLIFFHRTSLAYALRLLTMVCASGNGM